VSLLCPKCMNPMRQYERNRVVVDQCVECGGLFLDRGELETLVQAERSYYGEPSSHHAPVAPVGAPPMAQGYDRTYDDRYRNPGDRRYEDSRGYDDRYYGKSKKRKARSFLEELFDD
jgi:Zn-finger nucleic acid-binding protein